MDEAQVEWALKTGLGPLLFHVTKADPNAPTLSSWTRLKAADLTARIITAETIDTMEEIVDACAGHVPPLTLLKGISLCSSYYPEPHLRLMRDIDVLVEDSDVSVVAAILSKLGYVQPSHNSRDFYATHHHEAPFFHPQKKAWLEVHTGLFPLRSRLGGSKVFGLENLRREIRRSTFRGRTVNRFSKELQITYTACHWGQGFNVVGGMFAMLDTIYILKDPKVRINWETILEWTHGSAVGGYVYLLLSYLAKYRLISIGPEILRELLRQRPLGSVNERILHGLIDHYLVSGRPFRHFLNLRNLDIIWKTCLLPATPFHKLLLLPVNLLIPFRLRESYLN